MSEGSEHAGNSDKIARGSQMPAVEDVKEITWRHSTWFYNLIHDLFFDAAPHPDELLNFLNTSALVSALMLSVIVGFSSAYSFEDYKDAIGRMNDAEDDEYADGYGLINYEFFGYTKWTYYEQYYKYYFCALYMLGISLILVVLIIMLISHTSFEGPNGKFNELMLNAWWGWARWVVLIASLLMILGLVLFFFFLNITWFLMAPDKSKEQIKTKGEARKYPWMWFIEGSPGLYGSGWAVVVMVPCFFVCLVMLSQALTNKHRAYISEREEFFGQRSLETQALRDKLEEVLPSLLVEKYGNTLCDAELEPEQLPQLEVSHLLSIGIPLGHAISLVSAFKQEEEHEPVKGKASLEVSGPERASAMAQGDRMSRISKSPAGRASKNPIHKE